MTTMSKRYLFAGLGVLALAAALAILSLAQLRMGPGGPGGMMGPGYGPTSPVGAPVTLDDGVDRVKEALRLRGDHDLAVADVMEFSNHFYVLVKEKSTGIGAFELIVGRDGSIRPEPGPNMMWNTKYGHMTGFGRMMGYGYGPQGQLWSGQPNAPAQPLTIERARQIAGQYLSTAFRTAAPDQGTAFYGYFTFDVKRDGKPFGMLSVNAYTGQVWYHTWHGRFVGEREF
jgi:hypothetical protein